MGYFESGYVDIGYEWVEVLPDEKVTTFNYSITPFDESKTDFNYNIGVFINGICDFHYSFIEQSFGDIESKCNFKYNVFSEFDNRIYQMYYDVLGVFENSIVHLHSNLPIPDREESQLIANYNVDIDGISRPTLFIKRLNEND